MSSTWGKLGYGTLYWSAYSWTNVSSSKRVQINYKDLKMTIHMQSWQLNNQIQKGPNPTASSEAPETKARYFEWSLHRAPQNGARRPPRPWLAFTSPPPGSGREQGNMFLVFLHWYNRTSTGKALPEFLIWPLVNFYWLKGKKKKVMHKNVRWQAH